MIRKIFLSLFLGLFLIPFTYYSARADFELTINPKDGTDKLRFGRVGFGDIVPREVTVNITKSVGKYEIKQSLLEPLRNDKGEVLSSGAISFYTLRGSNSAGSLYQDIPYSKLDSFDQLLYRSEGAGENFIIVYTVDSNNINVPGSFQGKIRYSLIPAGSDGTAQEQIINVYLDAEKKFDVEVITSLQSAGRLRLSTGDEEIKGYIKFDITGSLGKKYRIYQSLEEDFKNEKGEIIGPDIFKFLTVFQKGESEYGSLSSLSRKRTEVYSSDSSGEADAVVLNFSVDKADLKGISKGHFTSKLKYTIEADNKTEKEIFVDVELEVQPVFTIEVSADFKEGLSFGELDSKGNPVEKEAVIKIKTNVNRPYVVIQKLTGSLTNEKGQVVPSEDFMFKERIEEDKTGTIAVSEYASLKAGDKEIFFSDDKGSPSEFKVVYYLKASRNTRGGKYFANVGYSLVEK